MPLLFYIHILLKIPIICFIRQDIHCLKKLKKEPGIRDSDIVSLSDKEIIELFLNPENKNQIIKHIADRKIGFAIMWLDGEVHFVFGNDANYVSDEVSNRYKVVREELNNSKDMNSLDILKGNVANQGIVKGYAKLLFEYDDIKKVNVGDIIVTSMTTPIFVSAMEKASAFVTDEGGITCHAAIISREFGVPCVVGTICSTKKISDGDYIEVDAYKGIIKILKKN